MGLGNPGPTYASTRHNVGAMVIDELVARYSGKLSRHKRALANVAEMRINSHQVIASAPLSYMNESGGPVKALASFYKIPADHIIVLHDELDIPMEAIRVKLGGGDNGHNGLKSIRGSLGTGEWLRVRLGIGRPVGRQEPSDFVLQNFRPAEKVSVDMLRVRGADAVERLISEGLIATQNEFNS